MIIFLITAAIVFIVDLLIKRKITAMNLEGKLPKNVGRLHIKRVENHGMLFGLGKQHPKLVKILPSAVGLLYLLAYLSRMKKTGSLGKIGWGMLVGGAAANAAEHAKKGYVVDYIRQPDIPKKKRKNWVYYNLADASLLIGFILTLFDR